MKECSACGTCYPDNLDNCPADGVQLKLSLTGDLVLDERYKLERRLGRGGMGIVFKAAHVFLKSTHAVKVILPHLVGDDPMLVTRFRQEAIVAASIRHKNIVLVTDFGVANGTMPFLVMEFLVGRSLWDILVKQRQLSSQASLEIMEAVAAGVGAAHRRGIVHRDLKPLNIFIQEGMPVSEGLKVLDFGLAKIKSGDLFGSFIQAQTTSPMGSPLYMAPEQWSEGEPDARADIYSIGVMLYQMLAGETPFGGSSMPKIMKGHLMSEPPPFAALGVRVSKGVESVVRRALEKDPQARQSSVEEFVADLRDAVSREDSASSVPENVRTDATEDITLLQVHRVPRKNEADLTGPDAQANQEDRLLQETQSQIEDEADQLMRELEDAQRRAEEARRRVEEAAQRRAADEAERKRAEADAARKRAEEEKASKRAQEEERKRVEEEKARKLLEEAEALRLAEEEVRRKTEEERARRLAIEEADRLSREVEEVRRRAEEARERAEEEAQGRVKEEAARRAAEERAALLEREVEEAQRRLQDARERAEAEEKSRAEEEVLRRLAEEQASQKRASAEALRRQEEDAAHRRADEEAARLAQEIREAQSRAEKAGKRAEEEAQRRMQEEVARKRAEEEASRLAREVEEAQRRAEDVRKAAEQEARRRAAKELEQKHQLEAAEAIIKAKGKTVTPAPLEANDLEYRPAPQPAVLDGPAAWPPSRDHADSVMPRMIPGRAQGILLRQALSLIAVALVALLGYGTYRFLRRAPAKSAAIQSDMVSIPGGSFLMGRNDVSEKDNQWPAHETSVKGFFMDRTEVTNAEYSEFLRQSGYQAPKSWSGASPPAGRERWPVTDVSLDDARAFAAWRSTRDGVKYRLPTEEEWEYAARGGSRNQLYPWGDTWYEDRANLGTGAGVNVDFPKPVGSYAQGASPWGVLDMIGNVWEWTSSEASLYPGNISTLQESERGQFVMRGGSHQSLEAQAVKFRKSREFPATFRQWFPRETRSSTLGFRLVRDAS
jgi:formylglycine-generating enzyme required for sulfatase activity/serine/threonine protein kinase